MPEQKKIKHQPRKSLLQTEKEPLINVRESSLLLCACMCTSVYVLAKL